MRVIALVAAIIAYTSLSSPTPDQLGIGEWIVIACLGLALIHPQSITAILDKDLPTPLGFHRLFLFWMLSVPLIIAVIQAQAAGDIIRDIIPMFLLALPIIMPQIRPSALIVTLVIGGALFAGRYVVMVMPDILTIGLDPGHDAMLYLANSPLVPFTAIMGFAWLTDLHKKPIIFRLFGFLLCGVAMTAMALMVQRAPFILSILACLTIMAVRTSHSPLKSSIIGTIIIVACLPILNVLVQVYGGFIDKTLMVGANNRIEEFMAVISDTTLLGYGWGAQWQSPAVADYWVRYTHNMVSYYWLKAGILGAILAVGFIYIWLREAFLLVRHNITIGMAIITPLCIHFFLYTGYKTFDISLLLALIIVCKRDRHPS